MMKIVYFIALILLFSCSRSVEDRCFTNDYEQIFKSYTEKKPFTAKEILKHKPDYLAITDLKKYRTFKEDNIQSGHYNESEELSEKRWKIHEEEYKIFKSKFSDQFLFSCKQQVDDITYALGTNELGSWLLKIENNEPYAYFLGLSFSHYYINNIQDQPIMKDGFLQLQGSFVKIVKVDGLPGYDDYSAISDGKLFKISLKELTRDSDHDGYNDIFEQSFGLNANSKDTDRDGMSDFDDLNPMFTSVENKFTELYKLLLPTYAHTTVDVKELHYTFTVFESDCDYFHQVSPDERVLFIPESDRKKTFYVNITDVTRDSISKIRKDKANPDRFYISKSGSSFENVYAAEYKNGEWILKIIGGIII